MIQKIKRKRINNHWETKNISRQIVPTLHVRCRVTILVLQMHRRHDQRHMVRVIGIMHGQLPVRRLIVWVMMVRALLLMHRMILHDQTVPVDALTNMFGRLWFGLLRFGLLQFGLFQFGLLWFGLLFVVSFRLFGGLFRATYSSSLSGVVKIGAATAAAGLWLFPAVFVFFRLFMGRFFCKNLTGYAWLLDLKLFILSNDFFRNNNFHRGLDR